ncbi:MAG: prolyl oligopeptidase family serine peptidase [Mucilaginibacter sp.]|uniref:S9 family peptidase n=1 Tax=Mucilaginibacter sp. TaxID=1882438 RepID=UPI0032647A39
MRYIITKKNFLCIFILLLLINRVSAQKFKLDEVLSYPFPTELTSCAQQSKIAWAVNQKGLRNIYVATGPYYNAVQLSHYSTDDGQEITSLSISANGRSLVYVRGGDHSSSEGGVPVNPGFDPAGTKVQVWTIPFAGGEPHLLGEGDYPVISPKSDNVAFVKSGQVWLAPINGSAAAKPMFSTRGNNGSLQWSPNGDKLAFVSSRVDHAFIGIFTDTATPIQWLAPSFSKDASPRWSADGSQIAFVRTPGTGGEPDSILTRKHLPWAIWTANVASGKSTRLWEAPKTLAGSIPTTDGGVNLNWAAGNRIVFISYQDGWPHLYSLPASGGQATLLTPGNFMVEQIEFSDDKKFIVFSANTGTDKQDIDRRHLARVSADKPDMQMLTSGNGIEAYPVITENSAAVVFLSSTAQRPLIPAHMQLRSKNFKLIGEELIPANFPRQLAIPKQVIFNAPDGTEVHAQLFEPAGVKGKRPAIVYIHGGPQRQMVLGWHFMDYYSIDYALNQYLVSLGFDVLSVNYRTGVGYGYEFNKPANAGAKGASEYQDIKTAGQWLATQPQIDGTRIGIYGGSYGGFLTGLGLAHDSKLFAAGVDIHGVNNWLKASSGIPESAPDAALATKIAFQSSPAAWVSTWTSPVLLIHADDDRNVQFTQTVDLTRRLESKGIPFEYLSIPDDTHHWMKYSNALTVSEATAEFLKRKLLSK